MNSIFTIIQKKGKINLPNIVDVGMLEIWCKYSLCYNTKVSQNTGCCCYISTGTPEAKNESMPYLDTSSGCCVTADARIDYRAELIEQLNLSTDQARELPDNRLILLSYLKWGYSCVDYLFGDFAFVIWDKSRNRIFCARDHFGCRPLYYVNREDYIAVASDPESFKAIPGFIFQINDQLILDTICSIVPNKDVQTYLGVSRLEPAHILTYSPEGTVQVSRYWDLRIQENYTNLSKKDAVTKLRDLFIEAVKERSQSLSPIGVELSGGLDSSSIASCLNQVIFPKTPIYAFSHTLNNDQPIRPVSYSDEYRYSSIVVSFNKLKKHFLINGDNDNGSYAALINFLSITKKPTGQSFAMMSDLLYKHANKAGIKVLLSGLGGDEGVTYQGVGLLEELAARKDFEKLKKVLRGRIKKKGGSYYRQRIKILLKIRMPRLMRVLKKDWRKSRFKTFAFDRRLGFEFGMRQRYLKRVQIPSDPDVRKRQYKRIMNPHIADRLENSYFLAKAKGIEYRYPFLDVKLIEFFYSIPSEYKYHNGTGRYLFRMAMKGILPEEIRLRNDKTGATIPNVMTRVVKDELLFRELIEEGRRNNRFHYVDYDRLHWMLDQFKHKMRRKKLNFGPRAFLGPMCVLILQKWQREGEIDIGIKC